MQPRLDNRKFTSDRPRLKANHFVSDRPQPRLNVQQFKSAGPRCDSQRAVGDHAPRLCLRGTFIDDVIESPGSMRRARSADAAVTTPANENTNSKKEEFFCDERAYVDELSEKLVRLWDPLDAEDGDEAYLPVMNSAAVPSAPSTQELWQGRPTQPVHMRHERLIPSAPPGLTLQSERVASVTASANAGNQPSCNFNVKSTKCRFTVSRMENLQASSHAEKLSSSCVHDPASRYGLGFGDIFDFDDDLDEDVEEQREEDLDPFLPAEVDFGGEFAGDVKGGFAADLGDQYTGEFTGEFRDQTLLMMEEFGECPNQGSIGHPELCMRPCVFFSVGRCVNGRSCGYCHLSHRKRPLHLDKRNRDTLKALTYHECLVLFVPVIEQKADASDVKVLVDDFVVQLQQGFVGRKLQRNRRVAKQQEALVRAIGGMNVLSLILLLVNRPDAPPALKSENMRAMIELVRKFEMLKSAPGTC